MIASMLHAFGALRGRLLTAGACALAAASLLAACARAQESEPPRSGSTARDAGAGHAEEGVAGGAPDVKGLKGLDDVLIGVNDPEGAAAAYERYGFNVLRTGVSGPGEPAVFIALEDGYLEFVGPGDDSLDQRLPYTFEGGLAQGWEVEPIEDALADLRSRGAEFVEPPGGALDLVPGLEGGTAAGRLRRASPRVEPIAGTSVYLLDYETGSREFLAVLATRAGVAEPFDHPNGARRLAYVTVAVRRLEASLEILEKWGLHPGPALEDARNAHTVAVPLGRGTLYLTEPLSQGGVHDFLEERRAQAPPAGDRYFEGSILAIGIGVDDLDALVAYLDERNIPHVAMTLPSGPAEVVQGAPGWNLRLEFVKGDGRPDPGAKPAPLGAEASPVSPAPADSAGAAREGGS